MTANAQADIFPAAPPNLSWVTMADREFARLSAVIRAECGIRLSPAKRTMLEGRLQKRLRKLGLASFSEYWDHLFNPRHAALEMAFLIDAVTTHKTDFFREPAHFDYLAETILPCLGQLSREEGMGLVRVWSAGCSSGEEPFTLAMLFREYAGREPGFCFTILATDISEPMLEKGRLAVYAEDQTKVIPPICGGSTCSGAGTARSGRSG